MKKYFYLSLAALLLSAILMPPSCWAKTEDETRTLLADYRVDELGNKYLAFVTDYYPEYATRLGVENYHSTLDPRDSQTEKERKEALLSLQKALESIKPKNLSSDKKIDYYILCELVNKKLFELDTQSQLTKNPLFYLRSINSIYDVLLKDFMPVQDRLQAALRRLEMLPQVLDSANGNLSNPPDIFVKMAVMEASVAYNSFDDITYLLDKMAKEDYTREQIKKVSVSAKEAIRNYRQYLEDRFAQKDYVDFRMGKDNYMRLVNDIYQNNISYSKIIRILDDEMDDAKDKLRAALTPIVEPSLDETEKANRTNKKGIIEINASDYYFADATFKEHPQYKEVLNAYSDSFSEATSYFYEHKAFPASDAQVIIAPAPRYLEQPFQTVTYLPPYPLVNKQKGDVLVALPEYKKADEILPQNFTYADIKLSAAENITPGKNLMYSLTDEPVIMIRKMSEDIFFANGWVKYALETAKDVGYLNSNEDALNLAWYNYKKSVFAMADIKMQAKDFTYTQAIDYIKAAGIKEEEATAAVNTLAVHPLEDLAAVLGAREFKRVKEKYQKKFGKDFNLLYFHKHVLDQGRIPINSLEEAVQRSYEKKESVEESFFSTTHF